MYSRPYSAAPSFVSSEKSPYNIPDNYSGNAFREKFSVPNTENVTSDSEKKIQDTIPYAPQGSDVKGNDPISACDSCSKEKESTDTPQACECVECSDISGCSAEDSVPVSSCLGGGGKSSFLSGLFPKKLNIAFPFEHGIGFEELMLIGIILLTMKQENTENNDLLWILGFLLLCG